MTSEDQTTLEALVDRWGLHSVTDTLSGICGLKSEHITSSWQDNRLAAEWAIAEAELEAAANRILDLNLDGR